MKYCPNCGKELFDEAIMCPECKTSFLKYHKLTFLHRHQALPLINPAISISVDGYEQVSVAKSDSVVYKLCAGMHHIKLTGKGKTAEFDINLTDNIIIMAEWNATTDGIDYRETSGEIIDSAPVNFEKEVENSKIDESKKEQQKPSEYNETAVSNDSVEDNQKVVDNSSAVETLNAKSDEKRNEKALIKIFIGFGCCVLILVTLILGIFVSAKKDSENKETINYSLSTTVADSEKSDTETKPTESTTENTTESKNSTYGMVSLDDYKRATQNINLGVDSVDISVDDFHSSYDGTGILATLYFKNIDVGAIIISTETIGSTEYIKSITVTTSLSKFSDHIQTKNDAVAIGTSITMSAIMPLLNNCQYFDSNDITIMLKNTVSTDGETVEGDSNNYHYSYSQPSYTQVFAGCEFNN